MFVYFLIFNALEGIGEVQKIFSCSPATSYVKYMLFALLYGFVQITLLPCANSVFPLCK